MGTAKGRAIPCGELPERNSGRQHVHRRRHTVAFKTLAHGRGWHHDRIELVALPARESPRLAAQPPGWDKAGVMLQIFLEQGVIGGDYRQTKRPRRL